MTIAKLYSYYWSNLWSRNWIKITLLTLFSALWAFFILSFIFYRVYGSKVTFVNAQDLRKRGAKVSDERLEEAFKSYSSLCNWGLSDKDAQSVREVMVKWEEECWKDLEEARAGGDQTKIKNAENELRGIKLGSIGGKVIFGAPSFHWDVNDFFLQPEHCSKGIGFWRLMNDLSWWALASGTVFAWLTLSIVNFLFVSPKKNGEEVLVLNFTPGVKRSDLLISKILVFLTYFALFSLLSFVLPCLFYYLWIGGIVSVAKFLALCAYLLIMAPLLIFGLLLLPYILVAEWSPGLASLLPWLLVGTSWGWGIFKLFSTQSFPRTIEYWVFHPAVFTALAVAIGLLCGTIYYWKSQTEDLKK